MSHRLYIYSVDQKNADSAVDTIIEAKYELPLYFYPLFVKNAKCVGSDIFASAPEGVAFFEQFYDFLDSHAAALEIDKKTWKATRKKISAEFENVAAKNLLYLEMSDVFNMSEQPHKLQADAMLSKIQLGIEIIQDAITANNPLILDQLVEYRETGLVDFKAYLNYENNEFSWAYFDKQYAVDNNTNFPEIFQEGEKYGIKNAKGKIITPVEYDNIYYFSEYSKLCVAEKNNKFVYLNTKGEKEFDAEFDDLFDFFDNYEPNKLIAIAKLGEHYGLVNRKGQWVVKPTWDDLSGLYDRGQLIAAKKGEVWGVIDEAGKVIIEPSLPFKPEPNDEYDTSYYTCAPEDGEPVLYLSLKWKPFTLKNHEKTESIHARDDIKTVLGEGKEARYGLLSQDAETLLETIYNEIEYEYEPGVYRVKQDKKWGLFHPMHGWLLPCEFDSLNSVYGMLGSKTDEFTSPLWIARKGKQYGAFNSKKRALPWVLDCTQGKITPFAKNVLGVIHNAPPHEAGVWAHSASTGEALAGPYISLSDCYATLNFAAVLAFTDNAVFTVGQTGLVKPLTEAQADSLMMQMPDEDIYGELYFTYAQGDLIKKHFSKKLNLDYVFEDAEKLSVKGQYKQALEVYLQAAADGNMGGYVNAGYLLASQPEIEDLTLARQYYQLAADAGEPQGMNNLGDCYRHGHGGPQDTAKAIALFKLADEKYNMMATQNLAELYYFDETLQDHAQALKYFLKCYREYPRPLEVGYCYDNLLQDYTSALKYYQLAGKDGSGYALNRIGGMWEEGLLGKVDLKKAQEFYQKAMQAELSEAYAGLNLASLLINSDPVAAKAAWQFAVDHEDVVQGLSEFGQAQGWL
jgi:uncharacterized protein